MKTCKIMKLVVALALVLSLMPVAAVPFASAQTSAIVEDVIIADFTQDEAFAAYNSSTGEGHLQHTDRIQKSTQVGLSGKSSAKYFINDGGSGTNYYIPADKQDFTKYDVINFWAYNDGYNGTATDATKCFKFTLRADNNKYLHKQIYFDWTGWKKFSISKAEFTGDTTTFNWKVTQIYLQPSTGTDVDEYWDEVYFDRIWLSDSDPGYLILDMNSISKYKHSSSGNPAAFIADSTLPRYDAFSAKWNVSAYGNTDFYNNAGSPFDMTPYTHINFAMYGSGFTGTDKARTRLTFYSNSGSNFTILKDVNANWNGWQYFTVDLSTLNDNGGNKLNQLNDIKTVRFLVEGVPSGAQVNLDRIILTNGAPTALSEGDFSLADNAEDVTLGTNKITLTYSNQLSEYIASDAVTVKKDGAVVENGFVFGTKGKTVEIFFDELELDSTYTISVNKAVDIYGQQQTEVKTLTFKTAEKALDISPISFKNATDTVESLAGAAALYANYSIKNNTASDKEVYVLLAIYDKDHKMKDVIPAVKVLTAGLTTTISDLGSAITPAEGDYAKAFLLDGKKTLAPLVENGYLPYSK